jgi:hypothetical protein
MDKQSKLKYVHPIQMLRDLNGHRKSIFNEEVDRDVQYFNSAFAKRAVEFERDQKKLIFKVPSKASNCSVNNSWDSNDGRRVKV